MPQGQYSEADIQQAPATAQHGQYSEADVLPEQSFSAGAKEFGSKMNPVSIAKGIWEGVSHPITAAKAYLQAKQKMVTDAEDALSKGDWGGFLRHMQTAGMAVPGVDMAVEEASNKWEQGDKAGALGDAAALVAQTAIGEKAPAIARGAVNTGKYLGGAIPAAAPGVIGGMAKAGAGEVLAKVPGMELPARFGLQYPALRQVAKAMEKGHTAGMEAVKGAAPEVAAAAPVRAARAPAAPSVATPAAAPAPEAAPPAAAAPGKTAADLLNEEMGTKQSAPAAAGPTLKDGTTVEEIGKGLGIKDWTEAAPEAKAKARAVFDSLKATEEGPAATASEAPKAYTPRGPEYYGVKPNQTPPAAAEAPPQPAQSAPAAAQPASAAPSVTTEPVEIPQQKTAEIAETPAPRAASKAQTANAQAKADRFVQAIRKFNSDNPQQALSAEELAGAGDKEKGMLAQGLKQGGYIGNTEKFPDTSFPYILQKLKASEAEASQTIKPPAGFSLGAMKQYTAPEPAATPLSDRLQGIADDAMQRIRDRGTFSGTKLNAGVPVDDLGDMAIWGAAKIAKGTVDFAKWSKEMIADAGEQIKPYLQDLWTKAQKIYSKHVDSTESGLTDTKTLLNMYKQGQSGADWYAATKQELEQHFGPHADMMVDFLAATSPNTTVASNVSLALKAYKQWTTGQPFEGYLPATKGSLEKAAAGQDFGGLKVQSFKANLHGDPQAVTVDRWISRALGFGDKVSDAQYKMGDYMLTQIAKKAGMEPRQLQAAIWTAIKGQEGLAGNTSAPFEALLPKKIAADPQMQALIANAKAGGAVPARPALQ